jgi:hypothetical protein
LTRAGCVWSVDGEDGITLRGSEFGRASHYVSEAPVLHNVYTLIQTWINGRSLVRAGRGIQLDDILVCVYSMVLLYP